MVVDDAPGVATPLESMSDALLHDRSARIKGTRPILPQTITYTPRMIAENFPGCFPTPPAITQATSLLRRELLVYFFQTKINLIFDWHDIAGSFPILVWLRFVDPNMLRAIQGVSIIGLVKYPEPTVDHVTVLGMKDAYYVDALEAHLDSKNLFNNGGTWTDYVRSNLSLDFKTPGKTGRMEFELGDKIEYDAARGIREYKQMVVFK